MRFLLKVQHVSRLVRETTPSLRVYLLIVAILSIVSVASVGMLRAGQATGSPKGSAAESHGVDLTILDKTCKPCEDFFNLANRNSRGSRPSPAWQTFRPRLRGCKVRVSAGCLNSDPRRT